MVSIDFIKMCDWERKKAIFLLNVAEKLGMNTSAFGELAVNCNSGYTYLWIEDYAFNLYMPINCELRKSDVYALWQNPNNGEEIEMQLSENTQLQEIQNWSDDQDKKIKKDE